jgi:hypothetical protein
MTPRTSAAYSGTDTNEAIFAAVMALQIDCQPGDLLTNGLANVRRLHLRLRPGAAA